MKNKQFMLAIDFDSSTGGDVDQFGIFTHNDKETLDQCLSVE